MNGIWPISQRSTCSISATEDTGSNLINRVVRKDVISENDPENGNGHVSASSQLPVLYLRRTVGGMQSIAYALG